MKNLFRVLLVCLFAGVLQAQTVPEVPTNIVWGNFTGSQGPLGPVNALLLQSLTSGGVLCGTSSTNLASSNSPAPSANALMVWGGPGACPITVGTGGVVTTAYPTGVVTVYATLPLSFGGCGINAAPGSTVNFGCGTAALAGVAAGGGLYEVGIGQSSGNQTTSGNSNTSVGAYSLNYNTTGHDNVALGASALRGSTTVAGTGSENSFVGSTAGYNCQGACGNNVGIGYGAMASNTTGTGNLALGYEVGNSGMGTGSSNFLAGTSAAVTLPTTSTNNYINVQGVLGYSTLSGISASGVGTGAALSGNNTFLFFLTEGTGTPAATMVLTMLAVPTTWGCEAIDRTPSTPLQGLQQGAKSTTTVNLVFPSAPAAGDLIQIKCIGQ